MTWHTEVGDRHLTGAEARLFRAGLRAVLEEIEDEMHDFSHTLLAHQTPESLYQLFAYVGTYLLRPTDDMPPLNAWTEGAVGVVFRQLNDELQIEMDSEDDLGDHSHDWRKLIAAAMAEVEPATESSFVDDDEPKLTESDEYEVRLEVLNSRILWDDDWEVDDDKMTATVKESLGIPSDYFDWRLKPTMTTEDAIKTLGDLCGFRRGDFDGIEVE